MAKLGPAVMEAFHALPPGVPMGKEPVQGCGSLAAAGAGPSFMQVLAAGIWVLAASKLGWRWEKTRPARRFDPPKRYRDLASVTPPTRQGPLIILRSNSRAARICRIAERAPTWHVSCPPRTRALAGKTANTPPAPIDDVPKR